MKPFSKNRNVNPFANSIASEPKTAKPSESLIQQKTLEKLVNCFCDISEKLKQPN